MNIEQVKNITVIGAGDMGHGIAEVALLAGYAVTLYDINDAAVETGSGRILESVQKLAEKGKVPAEAPEHIKNNLLKTSTDLQQAASKADLVIEAAPEVMSLKKDIFSKLDQFAPKSALLASNTLTMSVTEIAQCTNRPSQVLGMHFFNPAVLMRLVEVIQADETSDDAIATGIALSKKFGKVPVHVRKDTPGFISNRVNQAPVVLVQEMVERGEVEPEGIDAFMRSIGSPMGPCELADFVGHDVMVNVCNYFAETLHPDYGPAPHLVKMVQEGNLGKKTGKGYFDWSQGRPEIDLKKATKKFSPLWLIFVQINEATKLVQQGVCSVNDVDLAMINSTGNPVGPMSVGRQISKWDLMDQLQTLASRYGKSIFEPTEKIKEGGYKH